MRASEFVYIFLQGLLKNKDVKLAQTFNASFRFIDDLLPLSNSRFSDHMYFIYQNELEVKDTTDTQESASNFDIHLEIDNLYAKSDDFTFPIIDFPFISNNIPAAPAYRVYISQVIRYSRAYAQYSDFLDRAQLMTQNFSIHAPLLLG